MCVHACACVRMHMCAYILFVGTCVSGRIWVEVHSCPSAGPFIKSPFPGFGLSCSSLFSCRCLNRNISPAKAAAAKMHKSPHCQPQYTNTNIAAAHRRAAEMQQAIRRYLKTLLFIHL